jgi:uncharacterized protein YbjT (DUF2867 family)
MRILITGSTGFIGAHLVREAVSRGHTVVALSRSGAQSGDGIAARRWQLGEPLPLVAGETIDAAIHLAHDFNGEAGAELTRASTLAAALQLAGAGVQRQLFYSSYSASPQAVSLYGRTKQAIESALLAQGGVTVVRPGLVMGDGGIYARIAKVARIFPLVPLPDGGRGLVPVIGIERLCRETLALCEAGTFVPQANLFEPQLISLGDMVRNVAAAQGRRLRIIPVPATLFLAALDAVGFLRIKLPVNADNLRGFLANQASLHTSTLEQGE